jgi:UDP-N-acetylglucosamine--N-acetylmuramyl-(pentapeptide) pyrophosphoryl-undecaprenol N-acetylglucosamine transferase
LISGGGTGGHIFPALAVAQALAELDAEVEILYVGREGGMEERIVPQRGIEIETLRVRGVQPEAWRNFALAVSVPAAVLRASRLVARFQPHVVFGTGGYVVGPVGVAASLRRRPLVLQLPDAVPGRTIRSLAPRAHTVCLEFESSAARLKGRTEVTGTPVRPEFAAIGRARRAQPRAAEESGFRLVVFGGSQGAHRLNTAVAEGLKALLDIPGLSVRHLSGELDHDQLRAMRSGLDDDVRDRYTVEPFTDAMAALMESADLILARAGGSAIAEMTAVGAPMVLVPYPYAGDHQRFNAEPVAKAGAAIVVPDGEFSGVRLVETVRRLAADRERLRRMAGASLEFGRPDAAEVVARIVLEAAL